MSPSWSQANGAKEVALCLQRHSPSMPGDAKEPLQGFLQLDMLQQQQRDTPLHQQPDLFPESLEGEFSAASAMSHSQSSRYMQPVESVSSLGGGCNSMHHAEGVHSLGGGCRAADLASPTLALATPVCEQYSSGVEDLVSSTAAMKSSERAATGPGSGGCGLRSRLLLAGGEGRRTWTQGAGPLPCTPAVAGYSAASVPPPLKSLDASSVDGPRSSGSSGCRRGSRSTVQLGGIMGSGTCAEVSLGHQPASRGTPSEQLPAAPAASVAPALKHRQRAPAARGIIMSLGLPGALGGSGASKEEEQGEAEEADKRRGRMLGIMSGHQARKFRRRSLIQSCHLDLQSSGQRTSSSSEEAVTAGLPGGGSFVVTASMQSSGCASGMRGGVRGQIVAAGPRRPRRAVSFSHPLGKAEDGGLVGVAGRHSAPRL